MSDLKIMKDIEKTLLYTHTHTHTHTHIYIYIYINNLSLVNLTCKCLQNKLHSFKHKALNEKVYKDE